MTDCELESWVQLFERRALWLGSRNIPFVVAVVPDKESVYPEMMPGSIPRSAAKSRADRFIETIRSRTQIPLVDLRVALTSEKKENRTYYLTDTHWSRWGAYSAYRELLQLINKTAPGLASAIGQPLRPAALKLGVVYQPGDLSVMLGLNAIAPEQMDTFEPVHAPRVIGGADDPIMLSGTSNPAQPRLVMVCDSFGAALMPYLGNHFARVYAANSWMFNPADVISERADVVVVEIVERRFNDPPPMDPESGLLVPSEFPVNPQAWGLIDEPPTGANVSGPKVRISGWALALQPTSIEKIEILMDGKKIGKPALHLPRPDVEKAQPGQRDSATAGVEMILDSKKLKNGRHEMIWKVTNSAGKTEELRKRQFCVAN